MLKVGPAVAQLVEATSQKVAGSIPDGVIGIFRWHNPSGRTVALGLTQPLTEMSTVHHSIIHKENLTKCDNVSDFIISYLNEARLFWATHLPSSGA
jgi:hypothetical protein